ncbi:hypothetical protein PO250_01800 [Limosilactobacillus mucosae]|uniref:Uncharacterized protein n=1 Tax=Limosilactobacillus mucosae TaxID=97478 RepID=A0AAJ1HQZ7_LIMMU|nr:hypothetical protein [Limosilactobacillus mucosae]MDC2829069.1 hypothetical protein [Limosilactobacillus mucosae]
MIKANYYANWSTAIITAINIAWIIEIIINGFIQRKLLNSYVKQNWKLPIFIVLALSLAAAIVIYIPLGLTSYVISFFALVVQTLMAADYYKVLSRFIKDSWYLVSIKVSMIISILSALSILLFAITAIAVTDY